MASRGKYVALLGSVPCLAILCLAAHQLHDPIVEAWYLHKIETGSPEEVRSYGKEFRDFASVRAIPGLLGILKRQKTRILDENDPLSGVFFATTESIGSEAVAAVIQALNDDERAKAFSRTIWSSGTRALIGCLRHAGSTVRLQAARILQRIDGPPEAAIPGLLGLLTDPAKEIRVAGACALVHSLPGNLAVRREIRAGLRDPQVKMRLETSGALRGTQARLALPELTGALEDPNEDQNVRLEAAAALGLSGCEEALPALTAALRDPAISQTAVVGLLDLAKVVPADSPQARAAIAALVARLDTAQGTDLNITFQALGKFGPAAGAALPAAIKSLRSKASDRLYATYALRRMGPPAAPAVPLLIEALGDSLTKVRQNAAVALGAIGKDAVTAAPALAGLLADPQQAGVVRGAAAEALLSIGFFPVEVRKALIQLVKDDRDTEGMEIAAEALGAAADDEEVLREAISILEGKTRPDSVRASVARGLRRSKKGLKAARPALIAIAGDPSCKQELRAAAADALSELGPEAAEAVPLLLSALSDPQLHFTPFARALWKIDRRQAPAAVRAAKAFLSQEEYTGGAASILEEIGPEAKDAVPALIKHLNAERDESSTDSPARALAAVGAPAVPALVEVLAGDDMVLRSIAAETLGRIGAGAAAATPALEKAISGEDDEVRREAAKALGRIRERRAATGR